MQVISELIFFLHQKGVKPFDKSEAKTKLSAMYSGILERRYNTDKEAAMGLYKGVDGEVNYRKLKHDLRERLFRLVLEIDTNKNEFSDYQKAYFELHRRWVIFRSLTGMNANHASLFIASRLMRDAEKYDLTLLALDVASFLRVQYGLREPNDKKFKELNKDFNRLLQVFNLESQAEEMYATLLVISANNRSYQKDLDQKAKEYWDQLAQKVATMQTYKLQLYYYLIGFMRFTNAGDYARALETCKEAIVFFENRPYNAKEPLEIFYYQSLLINTRIKHFEDGESSAAKCMRLIEDGSYNWFKFRELFLQLILSSNKLDRSLEVLEETLRHPRFGSLPENSKEIWRIYEAYVYWLCQMGRVPMPLDAQKFKIFKFINETPIFSKDKMGVNIAILIIKFLWMLHEHRLNQLLDEVSALERYCYSHLRGKTEKRSYTFIKMLLLIPVNRFDLKAASIKAEPLLDQICQTPIMPGEAFDNLEIVPFETIWQILMESNSHN